MSFKKQMILTVLTVTLVLIVFNAFVMGSFVGKNFDSFIERQYEKSVEEIKDYAIYVLNGKIEDTTRIPALFGRYLEDMILSIGIYNEHHLPVIKFEQTGSAMHMMMSRLPAEEVVYPLEEEGKVIGYLHIDRVSTPRQSAVVRSFRTTVQKIGLQAIFYTMTLSLIVIYFGAKRMTRDLDNTARLAESIDEQGKLTYKKSKTKEVAAIQKTLMDQATRLRMKHRIRKEKADQLAHEARTPLTILKTGMEGVKDGVVELDSERMDLWLQEVDRLSKLLADVGGILKLDDDEVEIRWVDFKIDSVVDKVFKSIRPQFEKKGVRLQVETNCEGFVVVSDPSIVSQCLYNLLINALKFTPAGGDVALTCENLEDGVRISVADTGIGMEEEELDLAFSAYFRGSNTGDADGQGMGLHIVKKNMEALGGSVGLKTNDGAGLTAWIELPGKKMV